MVLLAFLSSSISLSHIVTMSCEHMNRKLRVEARIPWLLQ